MSPLFRLGLTGSIATGKSTALDAFAALGHPIISSDAIVHALYEGEAVAPVETVFPGVTKNGAIDRAALAAILVEAPARIAELEAVVHPLVRQKLAEFAEKAAAQGARLAVFDIPLLFETGHDYGLDAVAVTFCDEAEQRRRALARPGMTVEKLETILAKQLPQADKKARADYLIDTNLSLDDTSRQVQDIAADCLTRQAATDTGSS